MFSLAQNTLLLDIETTGLKRETDCIISIGIVFNKGDNIPSFKYLFLEDHTAERVLLENFLSFISNAQSLYSYYGKSFDYPFLLSRMEHHKLDTSHFLRLKLLDMKDALKHFTNNRQELEASLGFIRKSTVKGKEIIKLYRTYESSKTPVYRELILKHQEDELKSLISFHELYDLLMHSDQLSYSHQEQDSSGLLLAFKLSAPFTHSFSEEAFGWLFSFHKDQNFFFLRLPLVQTCLKQYLEPSRDYFYIESQRQIMHKSLAQFIPSSNKRRASKEECVIKKASIFFKIFTTYKVTVPLWYDDSKAIYIEAADFSIDLLKTQLFSLFFNRIKK